MWSGAAWPDLRQYHCSRLVSLRKNISELDTLLSVLRIESKTLLHYLAVSASTMRCTVT